MNEPFGALAPTPAQDRWREIGSRLPRNYFGRKAASLLLGPAGGRARRAYDVEIFGSQRARLHPFDNICEKRVFLTPQLWDFSERAFLAELIARHEEPQFNFVDVGANVGLYSLFVRAETRRRGLALRAVCIEPDPEMRRRLEFNVIASQAEEEIKALAFAANSTTALLKLAVRADSRGMTRIDEAGDLIAQGRPLAELVSDFERIDAMKVDIEGHEFPTLERFFDTAPPAAFPRALLIETQHEKEGRSAFALAAARNYRTAVRTPLNVVLIRND